MREKVWNLGQLATATSVGQITCHDLSLKAKIKFNVLKKTS